MLIPKQANTNEKYYVVQQICADAKPEQEIVLHTILRIVLAENEQDAINKFLQRTKTIYKDLKKLKPSCFLEKTIDVIT